MSRRASSRMDDGLARARARRAIARASSRRRRPASAACSEPGGGGLLLLRLDVEELLLLRGLQLLELLQL